MALRLARDLRSHLEQTHRPEDCSQLIAAQLARRDESFLGLVERAVFGNPRSPYRRLMLASKVHFDDVLVWVRRDGVEGALGAMYERGIYVTLDEFKGRRPI